MILELCLKALLLCLVFHTTNSHEGHDHGHHKTDTNDLGDGNDAHKVSMKTCQGVDLKWVSENDTWVTMEMSSFTKGYVSVGFCPEYKGTMEGCDIVVGWVSNQNATPYLFDYYARGNTFPELDETQDYELLEGSQHLGVTTIKFRRKWSTGDFYDADLKEGKVRVLWAWHPEDPASSTSYFKHAGNSRGHMMEDISLWKPSIRHYEGLHSNSAMINNYSSVLTCMILVCISLVYF